ncbi:hypothetical protein M413DRAFT_261489 [Hebeloma cylindrosporum]|uniref:Uncharacterized protein n=1 Tax=Hebeloma cylindrosporum TaxID=76867 RepID=A0A0C2Z0P6_HEBCY|nr:hypothetical protein M413DRAFT_261489 [Hebeloma cylindrosporum h7]
MSVKRQSMRNLADVDVVPRPEIRYCRYALRSSRVAFFPGYCIAMAAPVLDLE